MAIAGLGTYNSTSFYYERTQRSRNSGLDNENTFGLLSGEGDTQNGLETTTGRGAVPISYSRCITASIRMEEMYASQSADGEMMYSYQACEQNFKIWINSDGENKSYSIEGVDKNGEPYTKEFDPYHVDPEYADFPEFSALCLYIQNTDETADLLANEYFASDDIREKKNYLEMLGDFGNTDMAAGMQAMADYAKKLFEEMQNFVNKVSGADSFYDAYGADLLTMDRDELNTEDKGISHFAPNAPEEVKRAMAEAMEETGYEMSGKMNYISEMLIKQVENSHNGVENPCDIFGNSIESAISAARELLERIENPLTPISERGKGVEKYIEQEKAFLKSLIDKLENISADKTDSKAPAEEELIPLGFGFANAGNQGYGMSASRVVSPDTDDVIIRVKVAGGTVVDVNLSQIDVKNATPVEMFAYCQYMDSIGEGVNNKWGSWNALKMMSSPYDGADFGSLDSIMNEKRNWTGALAKSTTSFMDPKTSEITLSPSDLMEMLEKAYRITGKELKEKADDWRSMSDEEWDRMLEGIDAYLDEFKEEIKRMREMQEKAAKKAALEASSDRKTVAASSAALAAASGFGADGTVSEEEEGAQPSEDGEPREKNWTRKMQTDDQTLLHVAQEAQRMEKMAQRKIQELAGGDSGSYSYEYISDVGKMKKKEEFRIQEG